MSAKDRRTSRKLRTRLILSGYPEEITFEFTPRGKGVLFMYPGQRPIFFETIDRAWEILTSCDSASFSQFAESRATILGSNAK
jgi:hypothetical protein